MKRVWVWKALTVSYEDTAKGFIDYENRTGEAYKRKHYKAYYEKNKDGDFTIYYAERKA